MLQSSRPLLIGITGNIGSGKSTFCNLLESLGISVYYADTIANQRLEDPEVIKALLNRYSPNDLCDEQHPNRVDRKKLAIIVFNDTKEVEFLNSLIHPLVLKDMQEIVDNFDPKSYSQFSIHNSQFDISNVLCFEIPLLFEAGLEHCFDFIVLVYATEPTRLDRLIAKGESDVNARRRIENQLDDSYKIDRVDWIIDNNGNKEQLQTAIHDLIAELHRIPKRTIAPFA